jgi:hypothetical protein
LIQIIWILCRRPTLKGSGIWQHQKKAALPERATLKRRMGKRQGYYSSAVCFECPYMAVGCYVKKCHYSAKRGDYLKA